jgi:hypothetical protein
VTESGDIVEYYSENSRFDQKGIVAKEFIVTRQRALVDFNVEFAVVGKYKDCEGGLVLYGTFTKLKITILFHLKYKTMDNTIKKGHTPKKKQRFGQMKKKKLWYLYLDNSDLSCLDLAEKVKGLS